MVKVWPSILEQIAIAKTEPGDENSGIIFRRWSAKVDIRKLEHHAQNDPDACMVALARCAANEGIMEFVRDVLKRLLRVLHLTQLRKVTGTEGISALPFNGTSYLPTQTNHQMGDFP